jgi:hypothetical protein
VSRVVYSPESDSCLRYGVSRKARKCSRNEAPLDSFTELIQQSLFLRTQCEEMVSTARFSLRGLPQPNHPAVRVARRVRRSVHSVYNVKENKDTVPLDSSSQTAVTASSASQRAPESQARRVHPT